MPQPRTSKRQGRRPHGPQEDVSTLLPARDADHEAADDFVGDDDLLAKRADRQEKNKTTKHA